MRIPKSEIPKASSPTIRHLMQCIPRRDTVAELSVRRILHHAGLRFRVDVRPLAGLNRRADIVFAPARVAVFIDGCFWHGCPRHGHRTKTNTIFWLKKMQINRRRDRDTDARLTAAGWIVIRLWGHEDPTVGARKVARVVTRRRRQRRVPIPAVRLRVDKPPVAPEQTGRLCQRRPVVPLQLKHHIHLGGGKVESAPGPTAIHA
jgi:DNA mismatch endonuclease (patch repair protein)